MITVPSDPIPSDPIPSNKTFSKFQKGLSPAVNLKPPEPFPTPIKWKEYQWDPLGAAFAAGDKVNTLQLVLRLVL